MMWFAFIPLIGLKECLRNEEFFKGDQLKEDFFTILEKVANKFINFGLFLLYFVVNQDKLKLESFECIFSNGFSFAKSAETWFTA